VPRNKNLNSKNIILASDHAGFKLKEEIKKFLIKKRKKVLDLGTKNTKSVDYPDYAHLLSKRMKKNKNQFGILVCGSGTGMSMTANKHKNIRAALCYNTKSTKLSRLHNDANVMTIGSRLIKKKVALKCVDTFLKTNFDGGRHTKRVKKI
jgi:ribose 5-phosphate isomerase B